MTDKTPIKIIAVIVIPLIIAFVVRFVRVKESREGNKSSGDVEQQDMLGLKEDSSVKIQTTWLLPDRLLEVSAISWLDPDRFLCVQDELGQVFIYNARLNKIDQEIAFGSKGDYEGVAKAGNFIYVLRADGAIFQISDYQNGKPKVKIYQTHLTKKQDSESLTYDAKNNRLLIAEKEMSVKHLDYKGIYAFDLRTKKMGAEPVFKIDLNHSIFDDVNNGKASNSISPSDIAIHPQNGNLYILEGTKPKLLIMDPQGSMLSLYDLKKGDFPQPEGITFSPEGKMYISNEGNKDPGNILQVELSAKPE